MGKRKEERDSIYPEYKVEYEYNKIILKKIHPLLIVIEDFLI